MSVGSEFLFTISAEECHFKALSRSYQQMTLRPATSTNIDRLLQKAAIEAQEYDNTYTVSRRLEASLDPVFDSTRRKLAAQASRPSTGVAPLSPRRKLHVSRRTPGLVPLSPRRFQSAVDHAIKSGDEILEMKKLLENQMEELELSQSILQQQMEEVMELQGILHSEQNSIQYFFGRKVYQSAQTIQRVFRGFQCRHVLFIDRRERAAKCLQMLVRRHFVTKRVQHRLEEAKAIQVQCCFRQFKARRIRAVLHHERCEEAALIIQDHWRCYNFRSKLHHLTDQQRQFESRLVRSKFRQKVFQSKNLLQKSASIKNIVLQNKRSKPRPRAKRFEIQALRKPHQDLLRLKRQPRKKSLFDCIVPIQEAKATQKEGDLTLPVITQLHTGLHQVRTHLHEQKIGETKNAVMSGIVGGMRKGSHKSE